MEKNKIYVRKLKLKESVKTTLMIILFVILLFTVLVYQSYRVKQLENNNNYNDNEYSRVIQVNLTR